MKLANRLSLLWEFLREAGHACVRNNESALAARLRRRAYSTPCLIDTGVVITAPRSFEAAAGSALYHGTYILNTFGRFTLGAHAHLGAFCYVNVCYGSVTIGEGTAIGPHTQLIVYSNHYKAGGRVADEHITADISIGSNVFIGANCVILPGASIGDNVIVGANSLVRGTLAANSIYAGSPCRLLRRGWHTPEGAQDAAAEHAEGNAP